MEQSDIPLVVNTSESAMPPTGLAPPVIIKPGYQMGISGSKISLGEGWVGGWVGGGTPVEKSVAPRKFPKKLSWYPVLVTKKGTFSNRLGMPWCNNLAVFFNTRPKPAYGRKA